MNNKVYKVMFSRIRPVEEYMCIPVEASSKYNAASKASAELHREGNIGEKWFTRDDGYDALIKIEDVIEMEKAGKIHLAVEDSVKMVGYCDYCNKHMQYSINMHIRKDKFKNKPIEYVEKFAVCEACCNDIYLPEINDDNLESYYNEINRVKKELGEK